MSRPSAALAFTKRRNRGRSRVFALLPRSHPVADQSVASHHVETAAHSRPQFAVIYGTQRRDLPPWASVCSMTPNSTTYQVRARTAKPRNNPSSERQRLTIRRDCDARGPRSARERTATFTRQTQQERYHPSTATQRRCQRSAQLAALAARPHHRHPVSALRYSIDTVAAPRSQHADIGVVFWQESHTDRTLDWLAPARRRSGRFLLRTQRKSIRQETSVSARHANHHHIFGMGRWQQSQQPVCGQCISLSRCCTVLPGRRAGSIRGTGQCERRRSVFRA